MSSQWVIIGGVLSSVLIGATLFLNGDVETSSSQSSTPPATPIATTTHINSPQAPTQENVPLDITKLELPQSTLSENDEKQADVLAARANALIEKTDALVAQSSLKPSVAATSQRSVDAQQRLDKLEERLDKLKNDKTRL